MHETLSELCSIPASIAGLFVDSHYLDNITRPDDSRILSISVIISGTKATCFVFVEMKDPSPTTSPHCE